MISFGCPNCSNTYHVPDDKAGKRAKCPGCQRVLTVPARWEESAPPSVQPTKASSEYKLTVPPQLEHTAGKRQNRIIDLKGVVVAVGVVTFLLVIGFLIYPSRQRPTSQSSLPLPVLNDEASAKKVVGDWLTDLKRGESGTIHWNMQVMEQSPITYLQAVRSYEVQQVNIQDGPMTEGIEKTAYVYVRVDHSNAAGTQVTLLYVAKVTKSHRWRIERFSRR